MKLHTYVRYSDKPSAGYRQMTNLQHYVYVTEQSAVIPAKHVQGGDAFNSKTLGIKVGKC